MRIGVYLDNNSADKDVCHIVCIDNKNTKEDIKEMYAQKLVTAITEHKEKFMFYGSIVPQDKKIAKFTSEAITECLFDVGWYCNKNNLDTSQFEVCIYVPDAATEKYYQKALKKMGF